MRPRPRDSKGRWVPNLEGGLSSFALEVILVLALALLAIGVAAVALVVF